MPRRRIVMSYQALNWKKVKKLSCKSVRDNIMSSNVFQWGTSENNANYTPLFKLLSSTDYLARIAAQHCLEAVRGKELHFPFESQ